MGTQVSREAPGEAARYPEPILKISDIYLLQVAHVPRLVQPAGYKAGAGRRRSGGGGANNFFFFFLGGPGASYGSLGALEALFVDRIMA